MPFDSPLFAIPDCPEIKALLDKVLDGNEKAYYDFLRELQSPGVYGKWQLVHTLKYVYDEAKQRLEKLDNCYAILLYDLAYLLNHEDGLFNILPEANNYISLLKQAAAKENRGAQTALLELRKKLTKTEFDALTAQCKKLEESSTLDKHEYFLLAICYDDDHPLSKLHAFPDQNKQRAIDYFEKASKDKHPIAICKLDNKMYYKTSEPIKEIANLGHPLAIYLEGKEWLINPEYRGRPPSNLSVEERHEQAFKPCLIAATLGIASDAMLTLAQLYFNGVAADTESDDKNSRVIKALGWFMKSIVTFDQDGGPYALAGCFIRGYLDMFEDETKGLLGKELSEAGQLKNVIYLLIKAFKIYAPNAPDTANEIITISKETHPNFSTALSEFCEKLDTLDALIKNQEAIIPVALQSTLPSLPTAPNVASNPPALSSPVHAMPVNTTHLAPELDQLKYEIEQRDAKIEQQNKLITTLEGKVAQLQQQVQQNAANSQLWRDASEQRNNKRNAPDSLATADTNAAALTDIAQDKSDDLNKSPFSHRKAARGS